MEPGTLALRAKATLELRMRAIRLWSLGRPTQAGRQYRLGTPSDELAGQRRSDIAPLTQ